MKYLLSFTLCLFSFIGFAQKSNANTDTIYLKNGNSYNGVFVIEDVRTYQFLVSNEKKVSFFAKDSVLKISKGVSSINSSNVLAKETPIDSLTNENLLIEFKKLKIKTEDSGWHLKIAGGLGVTSCVFVIGGGAMVLAGVLTGKPVLTYIGAGVGGLGFVFTIPTFVNIHKAGAVLTK